MSSNSNAASAEGNDRPSREVAYRLFAAEFDDASFSYSESDEERAPNYVVTPTGARVNRLFAVGVLTEVEAVNDDVLRGRIVDPTGAFVSYAGQYQPDEMAFLDRASPPAFVALSGKARTFQPDDSDQVFTSVRPESMSRVDADTRDRWTVSTAEATLERIGVMAAALRSGLTGETLREALRSEGVNDSLAAGVPLAIDHYGTTPAYLAALRARAVEALEVVADERDSVQSLDLDPASAAETETSLASLAADLALPSAAAAETEPPEGTESAGADATAPDAGRSVDDAADADADDAEPAVASGDSTVESGVETADDLEPDAADESEPTTATATEEVPTFDESGTASTDPVAEESPTESDDAVEESVAAVETTEATETTGSTETTETVTQQSSDAESGGTGTASSEPDDDLGDFDDGPAEAEPVSSTQPSDGSDATAEGLDGFDTDEGGAEPSTEAVDVADATDADGMYELDEEERAEVEAEFGTEFSTGSEVAPAGEADIDVPSVEELEDEFEEETGEGGGDAVETTATTAQEPADASAEATGSDDADADATAGSEADAADAADDVDLEAAAVDAMAALDDGDGASREAVVGHVVDEYSVDPGAVEDAIQSALMSGQCYEPTEDSLKAI